MDSQKFQDAEFTTDTSEPKNKSKKRVPKVFISFILLALLIFITISGGFYRLDSGYAGVVTRFGEVNRIETEEGFKFKLPYLESVYKVNMEQRHKLEYGFRTAVDRKSVV